MSGFSEKTDPIEEILGRTYTTRDQVYDAITELRGIESDEVASGIIALCNNIGDNVKNFDPILEEELVLYAISSLEVMKNAVINLSILEGIENQRHIEKRYFERDGEAEISGLRTHEDEIIAAILRKGGDEAVEVLRGPIIKRHPEKVVAALKQIDACVAVDEISRTMKIDFNSGILPYNIKGLSLLADLHEQVQSGVLDIPLDSIREAVEELSAALLDVKKLLNCLRGGRYLLVEGEEKVEYVIPYDARPVSREVIGALREAFVVVDEAEITDKKYTPHFDRIVAHHEFVTENEKVLEEGYSRLSLASEVTHG